jgi:choice-of-anchor B domain-containing protein
MNKVHSLFSGGRMAQWLLSAGMATTVAAGMTGSALAHDPETFLKGGERIKNGVTGGGEVEAKRSPNTGRGMPSILGPFPDDGFGLDFIGQLTNAQLGVTRLAGTGAPFLSDIWGWTDQDTGSDCHGDEYALVGSSSGLSIARITDADGVAPDVPVFLGLVPTTNRDTLLNFWWDIKVWDNKAYWTTEVIDQGLGVFDLTRLCEMDGPPADGILEPDAYVAITLGTDEYRAAHNITVNVEDPSNSIAYLTGVRSFDRSLSPDPMWMVDLAAISDDSPPTVEAAGQVARISVGGELIAVDSHDAQVVTYVGPDLNYPGSQIAVMSAGFNEQLVVLDVSDPANALQISSTSYAGASFSHQGWFDVSQRYFFMGDEEDELFGISDPRNPDLPDTTRTYVFDMSDLRAPALLCHFDAPYAAIDHNMFVKGDKLYQANYTSGFTVWQIPTAGPNADLTDCGMVMLGHMDTEPRLPNIHMNHNLNIFIGPWGIYPYFASEKIIVSDGLNGLIISKLQEVED